MPFQLLKDASDSFELVGTFATLAAAKAKAAELNIDDYQIERDVCAGKEIAEDKISEKRKMRIEERNNEMCPTCGKKLR
jgi:hypothetical protein